MKKATISRSAPDRKAAAQRAKATLPGTVVHFFPLGSEPPRSYTCSSPRAFTHTSLPQGPSWGEVPQGLAMTEGDRVADIRDRAILMLMAIYGLRANEVRHSALMISTGKVN
jgi:hypothetical protein